MTVALRLLRSHSAKIQSVRYRTIPGLLDIMRTVCDKPHFVEFLGCGSPLTRLKKPPNRRRYSPFLTGAFPPDSFRNPHLPYGRRKGDAEHAQIKRWVELADSALENGANRPMHSVSLLKDLAGRDRPQ